MTRCKYVTSFISSRLHLSDNFIHHQRDALHHNAQVLEEIVKTERPPKRPRKRVCEVEKHFPQKAGAGAREMRWCAAPQNHREVDEVPKQCRLPTRGPLKRMCTAQRPQPQEQTVDPNSIERVVCRSFTRYRNEPRSRSWSKRAKGIKDDVKLTPHERDSIGLFTTFRREGSTDVPTRLRC